MKPGPQKPRPWFGAKPAPIARPTPPAFDPTGAISPDVLADYLKSQGLIDREDVAKHLASLRTPDGKPKP